MLLRPAFGPRFGRPGLIGPAGRTAVDPLIAALKELASLHQAGYLTDDEFSRAKARLLG